MDQRRSDDALFAGPTLIDVRLTLSAAAQASLLKEPRTWVEAAARIDGTEMPRVTVHLKGATSFMPLDKKPSWTLSFNRNMPDRRVFGLKRIHLNNSVQDSSYLCEDLAGELFRRARVPCARAAWAMVRLNERRLGLYVLKEALNKDFLSRHFADTDGNFYDGGLHHEIDEKLLLDSGDGPQDHSDLRALYAASVNPDLPARWHQLTALLDIDRFVSMMAMEALTAHIDGYSLMQNNYRIYFEPPHGRAVFIVHGLDRMFEQPELPMEPPMRAVLSRGILAVPEGRARYRQRLSELAEKVFVAEWINDRINAAIRLLEPSEPLVKPQAELLRKRIMTRMVLTERMLAERPQGRQ